MRVLFCHLHGVSLTFIRDWPVALALDPAEGVHPWQECLVEHFRRQRREGVSVALEAIQPKIPPAVLGEEVPHLPRRQTATGENGVQDGRRLYVMPSELTVVTKINRGSSIANAYVE